MKRLINQTPTPMLRVLLGLLPFVLLVLLYMFASEARLAENPSDKLLPSFTQIGDAIQRMAFEPS
ncbi:MAG TPA: lipid kinase, partial [Alcanivorax sp.]|nr:lipid kinase [Alcanivorax sp.]